MKKLLNKEHSAYGGVFFLLINYTCAALMTMVLQLSWASEAIAIADNLAYITAINSSVYSYTFNLDDYSNQVNPTLKSLDGSQSYNPLNDFNNMLKSTGLTSSGVSNCSVTWNGKEAKIKFGSFKTKALNLTIQCHEQDSVVEKE